MAAAVIAFLGFSMAGRLFLLYSINWSGPLLGCGLCRDHGDSSVWGAESPLKKGYRTGLILFVHPPRMHYDWATSSVGRGRGRR